MTERTTTRVALGVTLLPLIVAAVALIVGAGDYLPVSDHALIELRVRDIGRHPVVTGLYSRNGWSHPGPLLFYLVAPVHWISGGASIAANLVALAVNGASLTGMGVVARRRGGVPLLLVTLAAAALLVRTLGIDFLADPWNTYVTVLPFGFLVFLVWAMTAGESWAVPVGAFVASFLAQTHIGFVVLALPLLALGWIWFAVRERARARWPSAIGAGVLVVAWLPVAFATDNLGTAYEWLRDADDGVHTLLQGWRIASAPLAVPPEWLVARREPFFVTGEPVALYRTPVPWGLLGVVAAAWWSRRQRDSDGGRLLAAFAAAMALTVVAVWRTVGLAFDYRLRWTWILGLVALVVVGRAAVAWQRRAVTVLAGAALVVATVVSTVVATRGETPREGDGDVLAAVLPGLLDAVGDEDGQVLVHDGGYPAAGWYTRSLVLQLERRGVDARMPAVEGPVVGEHRVVDRDEVTRSFVVVMDAEIAERAGDPGLRAVASWTSVTPAQVRAHERLVAELDERVEAGELHPIERAERLHEHGLQVLHPAVAWAVTVFEEIPTPEVAFRDGRR